MIALVATCARLVVALALAVAPSRARAGIDVELTAADAAFDLGDHRRAFVLYSEVVTVDPDNERALVRLGTLLSWRGEFAASVRVLDRALAIDPGNEAARRQRAWALAWDMKLKPAARSFRELLRDNPDDSDARLGLARSLAWSGRFRESASACQEVIDQQPRGLDGRTCHAYAESLQGRYREAREVYRQVLAIDPANLHARLGLSRLDLWSGLSEDAFSRVVELKGEHPQDTDVDEMLFRLRQLRTVRAAATYDGSTDEAHNALDVLRAEVTAPLPRSSSLSVGIARSRLSDPTGTGSVDSLFATGDLQSGAGQRIAWRLGVDRKESSLPSPKSGVVGGVNYVWGLDRRWRAFGGVERSTLIYSPQILDNDIVNDRAGIGVSGTLGERWSVLATASAASVSDGNRFRGLSSTVEYRLPTWSTHLKVGYRLRLEDYAEHTGHGYFDPSNFVSHLGLLDVRDTFWRRRAYYGLHLEVGIQSFDYAGFRVANDHVLQWEGALGIPVGEKLYLEGYGSWSNYVLKSPSGFRSRRFGARFVRQLRR